jgi:prephenate dehydrogenase
VSAKSSEHNTFFQRAALIGTGMIGGSIGIALREKQLVGSIAGYDRDADACHEAVSLGAIDEMAETAGEAVINADLVILAVPIMGTIDLLKEILPKISPGALITDVGSTKGSIMATAETIIPPDIYYIGGHPMAGSEESGIKGADPGLLENAIYVLTPGTNTPPEIVAKLSQMLEKAGAEPLVLDPFIHDRAVAAVSHLPQMIAATLVQSVAGSSDLELVRTLAAGGFRDSTRIALSNPDVWCDICMSNRWSLIAALKQFKESFNVLEKYLTESNAEAIKEYLLQARDYRKSIPYRGRGILPELFEIIALVRDEPGVLGKLTGLLGDAGINIDAIEILHVRELSGGSIRLGFKTREQQQQAQKLLNENSYHTHCPGS